MVNRYYLLALAFIFQIILIFLFCTTNLALMMVSFFRICLRQGVDIFLWLLSNRIQSLMQILHWHYHVILRLEYVKSCQFIVLNSSPLIGWVKGPFLTLCLLMKRLTLVLWLVRLFNLLLLFSELIVKEIFFTIIIEGLVLVRWHGRGVGVVEVVFVEVL